MKYKLSIQKREGIGYKCEDGLLAIKDLSNEDNPWIKIEAPTDESIIEYDIDVETKALGVTRCYRKEDEVICTLTLFVPDLEPYKFGAGVKDGVKVSYNSKWDLSIQMTADEIINGNIINQEVLDV